MWLLVCPSLSSWQFDRARFFSLPITLFASSGNCRFRHGFPVLYIGVSLRLNIETKTKNSQTTYPSNDSSQADDSQKEENRKELHFRQASWGVVNPTSKWVVFYFRYSFLYRYLMQPTVFLYRLKLGQ